jgi:hypothetical protein
VKKAKGLVVKKKAKKEKKKWNHLKNTQY